MFKSLVSAIVGEEHESDDEQQAQTAGDEAEPVAASAGSKEHSGFSFWGVAEAVTKSVRDTAGDFVRTVQETDWKKELEDFGKEVQVDAMAVGHQATEFVDHLPITYHDSTERERVSSSAVDVADALGQLGASVTTFGRNLLIGTREFVEQVKDIVEQEIDSLTVSDRRQQPSGPGLIPRYSRFEAQVSAMQRDSSTYCDPPEDQEDFKLWLTQFDLAGKKHEVDHIVEDNAFMAELQNRIVPVLVSYEDFWTRYFYRLHELQQKHSRRQQLAQRAAQMVSSDEEIGWEDDEDEQEEEGPDRIVESKKASGCNDEGREDLDLSEPAASAIYVVGQGVDSESPFPSAALTPLPAPLESSVMSPVGVSSTEGVLGSAAGDGESQLPTKEVSSSGGDASAAVLTILPAAVVAVVPVEAGLDNSGTEVPFDEPKGTAGPMPLPQDKPKGSEVVGASGSPDESIRDLVRSYEDCEPETDGLSAESASDASGGREWLVVTDKHPSPKPLSDMEKEARVPVDLLDLLAGAAAVARVDDRKKPEEGQTGWERSESAVGARGGLPETRQEVSRENGEGYPVAGSGGGERTMTEPEDLDDFELEDKAGGDMGEEEVDEDWGNWD